MNNNEMPEKKISWQEIIEHAIIFAKKRGLDPIDTVICFEECAKFIAIKNNEIKE